MEWIRIYGCHCDLTRLRLIDLLQQGPHCGCHLQEELRIALPLTLQSVRLFFVSFFMAKKLGADYRRGTTLVRRARHAGLKWLPDFHRQAFGGGNLHIGFR